MQNTLGIFNIYKVSEPRLGVIVKEPGISYLQLFLETSKLDFRILTWPVVLKWFLLSYYVPRTSISPLFFG